MAGGAALGAPDLQAFASLLVDQLHAVISELTYDQIAVPVLAQPVGPAKLARARAHGAHVPHERAVGLEHRDAVVRRICDVDEAVLYHHGLRPAQVAVALAELAEGVEDGAVFFKNLDPGVVAVFADEDVALFVEADVRRVNKLPRPRPQTAPLAEQLSLGGVDHHPLVV